VSESIKNRVIEAIQTVYDPEIPINIWEIGLIYEVLIASITRFLMVSLTVVALA